MQQFAALVHVHCSAVLARVLVRHLPHLLRAHPAAVPAQARAHPAEAAMAVAVVVVAVVVAARERRLWHAL